MKHLLLVVAVAGSCVLAATAPSASAATTTCEGTTLAPGTYDALVVPSGRFCNINGDVTIRGNLTIEGGAFLWIGFEWPPTHLVVGGNVIAGAGSSLGYTPWWSYGAAWNSLSIEGNVIASNTDYVSLQGLGAPAGSIHVGGNVLLHGGAYLEVAGATVDGNLQLDGGYSDWHSAVWNQVGGSLEFANNTSRYPTLSYNLVVGNTVAKNLNCHGNDPVPSDLGVGDSVAGQKLGQCGGF